MRRFYRTIALAVLCFAGTAALPSVAQAQLGLPSVNDTLNRLPTRTVDDRLSRELERKKKAAEELAAAAAETAEKMAAQAAGLVDGLLRPVILDTDPNGATIEFNTIVVMVERNTLDAMTASDYEVMSKRELKSLGLILATLRSTSGAELSDAVQELRDQYPDAPIDYNHLYRFASETDALPVAVETPESVTLQEDDNGKLRIGVIDSAVRRDHRALRNVFVTSQDFVSNNGARPLTHGTAVASLLARSARDNVTILAASVFFQIDEHAPGATSEGLVAALDWLVSENVDVINMSLAGPGNILLQTAIARVNEVGPAIVAAVGNNGPSSDPLYPAAYEGVIGITAVDRDRRIFRYANRGDYVDYAALGVDVKVADSTTGGWRIESGTSMAAPRVSVIVAQLVREGSVERDGLMSYLMATAKDLGKNGFDKVFGHGLLSAMN